MQSTSIISRWLARSEFIAAIGLVGLLTLSLATFADVIMRTFLNSPIYGFSDIFEVVTPPIVASCLPVALATKQNITIRFLGRALPARIGQGVELFGQIAVSVFVIGITWRIVLYTWSLYTNEQVTWLLALPVWPFWLLTSALLVMCIPIQLLVTAETYTHMRNSRPLAGDHPDTDNDT